MSKDAVHTFDIIPLLVFSGVSRFFSFLCDAGVAAVSNYVIV